MAEAIQQLARPFFDAGCIYSYRQRFLSGNGEKQSVRRHTNDSEAHMRWITGSVVVGLLATFTLSSMAESPASAPLGSAEFQASPEHPWGWRGDGTGQYPGATPPRVWWRKASSSAVSTARYQAAKPSDDGQLDHALPLELGIVKDWLVLGPFASDDPEKDIDKPFIADEASIQPDVDEKVGPVTWKALHSSIDTQSTHYTNEGTCDHYNVDFVFLFGKLDKQVAYAHTYLYSPSGGSVQLSIHRDAAAAKIWVNGQPTVLNPKDWARIHKSNITLNKGWNRLLVKVSCAQSTGPMGQNPWISRWLFAAYISPALPATYETQNIAWMTKLPGFSASSPVVAGDRLLATCGTSDLICINKADGQIRWLTTLTPCDAASDAEKAAPGYRETAEPLAAQIKEANEGLVKALNGLNALHGLPRDQQTSVDNLIKQKHELEKKLHDALRAIDRKKYVPLYLNEVSGANGTPCTDGKTVFVAVGGGSKGPGAYIIAAYDLDGHRLWSYHEALGAGEHGTHVSPLLIEGKLIYGGMTTILAFDAPTGKIAWRDQLPRDAENCVGCLYIPARIGQTSVLVTYPNRVVRVADGKLLSNMPRETFFGGMTTPVIDNGFLYSDGDSKKSFQAVQLPTSLETPARIDWKLEEKQWRLEGSSGFSIASALVLGGLYYNLDTMGGLSVIDVAAKKPVYISRVEMYQRANRQTFGFTASPTLAGTQVYIFDNTGSSLLFEPGREFKEAGRNIIENQVFSDWKDYKQEMFYASPIFDGRALYLKGSEYLYCIREK